MIKDSLRMLNRFRIIEKLEGSWEDAETKLLILPTILFIVTNERISNMYRLLDEEPDRLPEEGENEETYEDAVDTLA